MPFADIANYIHARASGPLCTSDLHTIIFNPDYQSPFSANPQLNLGRPVNKTSMILPCIVQSFKGFDTQSRRAHCNQSCDVELERSSLTRHTPLQLGFMRRLAVPMYKS